MIEEIRIRDLGVIDEAVLSLHPGLTVLTGETGAGKTMVVTGLGLLLGGRGDSALVRAGADRVVVEGVVDLPAGHPALERAAEAGADVATGWCWCARSRPTAAPGPTSAAAPPPWACSPSSPSTSSPCTARPTSGGCAAPTSTARCSTRSAAATSPTRSPPTATVHVELTAAEAELAHLRTAAAERAREADVLRVGLERIEAVDPQPGEDTALGVGVRAARPRRGAARRCRRRPHRARR